MIRDKGDFINLDIIVEKYKTKLIDVKVNGKVALDETGKKLKEKVEIYNGCVITPTSFAKEGITLYGRALNHKYQIYKKRATIYDKFTQKFYVVNHTPEEIEQGLLRRSSVGFKMSK